MRPLYIDIALYKVGNYTGAIRYFDKALAIDPKYEVALTYKGIALDYLGKYTEALRRTSSYKVGNYTGAIS